MVLVAKNNNEGFSLHKFPNVKNTGTEADKEKANSPTGGQTCVQSTCCLLM